MVPWAKFCRDPYIMGDVCQAAGAGDTHSHQYAHVAPMTSCFATADGLPTVDWLGRMEHLDEDLASLIDILNARPGVPKLPRPPSRVERWNYRNASCVPAMATQQGSTARRLAGASWEPRAGTFVPCDKAEYLSGEHAHCAADLLTFFREDVTFFATQTFLSGQNPF